MKHDANPRSHSELKKARPYYPREIWMLPVPEITKPVERLRRVMQLAVYVLLGALFVTCVGVALML